MKNPYRKCNTILENWVGDGFTPLTVSPYPRCMVDAPPDASLSSFTFAYRSAAQLGSECVAMANTAGDATDRHGVAHGVLRRLALLAQP